MFYVIMLAKETKVGTSMSGQLACGKGRVEASRCDARQGGVWSSVSVRSACSDRLNNSFPVYDALPQKPGNVGEGWKRFNLVACAA